MESIPSILLLPGPLLPGIVVPVRVPSVGQKYLFKKYSYMIGPCENNASL